MATDPAARPFHVVEDGELPFDAIDRLADSRGVIEQAKAVLVERYQLEPDAAFAVLVRHSQHANRKLRAIAEDLIRTGQLPEDPTGL